MILGQHFGKVEKKGRIAFPKSMRDNTGDVLILSHGFEKSIIVFEKKKWEEVIGEIDAEPFLKKDARQVKRFLLGGASEVVCDAQGRFVLPAYLKEFAQITEEVVVLGLGKYAEIWDKKRWSTHQTQMNQKIEDTAQALIDKVHE